MAYTAVTWTVGDIITEAKLDNMTDNDAFFYSFLGDNLAWQSWTPTLVNLSGGTLNFAKYTRVGNTVFCRFRYTLGGAGVAGSVTISVPVTAAAEYGTGSNVVGTVNLNDTGTAGYYGMVYF